MEYKLSKEICAAIVGLLQKMPYEQCYQVLNQLLKILQDQDASKKAEEAV